MPEPASSPLPSHRPPPDDSSSRGFRRWFSGNRISRAEGSALLRGFFDDRTNGVYVDVGAYDPFIGSTSWIVEETGCSGVLVEPIPDLA